MQSAVRWRGLLWWCAVAVGATACAGGNQAGPTATLSTASPTTTADPYAIPEVIDVAYVNRVLEGLDGVVGDVTRMVLQTRTIPPEAYDRLKALYAGEFLQLRIDLFQADIRRGFPDYEPSPGNARTRVSELIAVRPTCIFARVDRDASAIAVGPSPARSTLWVALEREDPVNDPNRYNPTGWVLVYDGFQKGRVQPSDPCVGS